MKMKCFLSFKKDEGEGHTQREAHALWHLVV